jgi:hypothetical protein
MNEILGIDVDLDWLEGLDEPGDLIWNGVGWSLADVAVASAVQVSQYCSTRQHDFDLDEFFSISECGPIAVLAQPAATRHPAY